MQLLRYVFVFCCSTLIFCQTASSQEIWPGDINNNGIVNGVDLLYWGVAFGSTGPARPEISTEWQGIPLAATWTDSFVDGTNYAYADCDGSGLVDEDDYDDAIEDNFGLTHGTILPDGYRNGQAGQAPRVRLIPSATLVEFGATVTISLSLDDSAMPLTDFYGLAASLSYTTGVLAGDDGPDFDFVENNWIEGDNSYVQGLYEDFSGSGRAELAVTRTNQETIQAMPDDIGNFSIVIEDIIVGRNVDTFQLSIDSILVIGKDMGAIPVVPDTVTIIISNDENVTAVSRAAEPSEMKIYPNPARGSFYLELPAPVSEPEIVLIDQWGRTFPLRSQLRRAGTYRIEQPTLPAGIYWINVRTDRGWIGKKITLF